ncbi:MAG: sigma-70 family RNA polymerase sigma factor [Candidatus Sumerlaeia bacterium]|nr:sigma-70 family RNA polymerase sigma factor [Candidatus Sumerlaeia bacterium]
MSSDPPFTPEEETRLVVRSKRGDRAAFGVLVEAYKERAFLAALALVQNHDDARDMSQDAFVKAFRALDRFESDRPFFPWYYRILRNTCLSYLKHHGRGRMVSLDQLVEEKHVQFPDNRGANDPRQQLQNEEMTAHLREALGKLKPKFREIIAMKHFEEMTYEEIADALDLPPGTVMSRLFHARKALAKLMEKHRK